MASGYGPYWMLLLLGLSAGMGCRDPNPVFRVKTIYLDAGTTPDEHPDTHSLDVRNSEANSLDATWVASDGLVLSDSFFGDVIRLDTSIDAPIIDRVPVDTLPWPGDTSLPLGDRPTDVAIDWPKPDTQRMDAAASVPDTNSISKDTALDTVTVDASLDTVTVDASLVFDASLLNGETCTSSSQCRSGACTHGVCCYSQQCGPCESCNNPGSAGICTNSCPAGQTCQINICKPKLSLQRVSAGGFYSCKLHLSNALTCWRLDLKDEDPSVISSRYSEISMGFVHSCGLRTDGSVLCWGSQIDGRSSPPDQGPFAQVSAGGEHTCALRTDGSAVCWGKNHQKQVSPMPTGLFRQVTAGGEHSCALRLDGSVVCWGRYPSEGETYNQISAGDFHTCGVRADGSVSCWGDNQQGQAPVSVDGTFTQVSCGGEFSCGLKTNGSVLCWGGNGDKVVSTVPQGSFSQIDAGWYHVCALRADNSVICWGRDEDVKTIH